LGHMINLDFVGSLDSKCGCHERNQREPQRTPLGLMRFETHIQFSTYFQAIQQAVVCTNPSRFYHTPINLHSIRNSLMDHQSNVSGTSSFAGAAPLSTNLQLPSRRAQSSVAPSERIQTKIGGVRAHVRPETKLDGATSFGAQP